MESANLSKALKECTVSGAVPPLCVDLDGTILRTDLLMESVMVIVGSQPGKLFSLLATLLRGRAAFKSAVADTVSPKVDALPYHDELIDFLRGERASGRQLVLATASDRRYADAVASHLQLFDHVIGSDEHSNRRGKAKIAAIIETVGSTFDYVGDSDADIPIVDACRKIYLVRPSKELRARGVAAGKVERIFGERSSFKERVVPLIRLMRPHQWAKNTLVFVPMIAAHAWSIEAFLQSFLAFISFSAMASSIYIANDLIDIESDRKHRTKYRRPLASCTVSIPNAVLLGSVLFLLAMGLALFGGFAFFGWLLLYAMITTAYSISLKKKFLLDVLTLGWLYTHRVIAGAIITGITLSHWLLAFASFLFVSLAFAKRYAELKGAEGGEVNQRRGYRFEDASLIASVGPSTGLMAVLVLSLYINGEMAVEQYQRPLFLWLLVPIQMYWILRVWFLAGRGELDEDPIVFAIKDKVSYFCFLSSAMAVLSAI